MMPRISALSLCLAISLFLLSFSYSAEVPSIQEQVALDFPALLGIKEVPWEEKINVTEAEEAAFKEQAALLFTGPERELAATASLDERGAYRLANYLFFQGALKESLELLNFLIKRYPRSEYTDRAYFFSAEANLRLGDYQGAIQAYGQLLSLYPGSRLVDQAFFSSAWMDLALKRYGTAYEAVQRLLLLYPPSPLAPRAWYLAGLAKAGVRQYQAAADGFLRLLGFPAKSFDRAQVYYLLAYCFFQLGKYDRANEYLRLLEAENPAPGLLAKAIFQGALLSYEGSDLGGADKLFGRLFPLAGSTGLESPGLYWALKIKLAQEKQAEAKELYHQLTQGYAGSPWEAAAFEALLASFQAPSALERKRALLYFYQVGTTPEERETNYLQMGEELYVQGHYRLAAAAFEDFLRRGSDPEKKKAALFSLGESQLKEKQYALARKAWEQLLSSYPEIKEKNQLWFRVGEAAIMENNYPLAVHYLGRVSAQDPVYPQALKSLAELHFSRGAWQQAAATLTDLFDNFPQVKRTPEVYQKLGLAFFNLGDYTRSFHFLSLAYAKFPRAKEIDQVLFYMAQGFFKQSLYDLAVIFYDLMLGGFKGSPLGEEALYQMGESYRRQRNLALATASWIELYDRYPKSLRLSEVLLKVGDAYFELGKYTTSTFYYSKVISERPEAPEIPRARYGVMLSFYKREKYDEFIERAQEFLRLYPQDSLSGQLTLILGRYYQDHDQPDRALSYYEGLIASQPKGPGSDVALVRTAQILQKKEQPAKAALLYRRLLHDFPTSLLTPDALYGLGIVSLEVKEPSQALSAFDTILNKYPQSKFVEDAFFYSGESCRRLNNLPCARVRLTEFTSRSPAHPLVHKAELSLGLIDLEEKNYSQAAEYFLRAASSPDSALAVRAYLLAARSYTSLGMFPEAEATLDKVITNYVSYEEEVENALLLAGELYLKVGRLPDAEKAYQRIAKESKLEVNRLLAQEKLKEIQLLKGKGTGGISND